MRHLLGIGALLLIAAGAEGSVGGEGSGTGDAAAEGATGADAVTGADTGSGTQAPYDNAAQKAKYKSSDTKFADGVATCVLTFEDGSTASGTATYSGDEPQGEARNAVKAQARDAALASVGK